MIPILFQDEHICVIDKPVGYVVHKTRGAGKSPLVLQTLRDQIGQLVYPVHRLDRGTSGCLAFALSSDVARKLQDQLRADSAVKKYTALCLGTPDPEGIINRELTNENKQKQSALTKFRVVRSVGNFSLIELQILTGRKHQIRRHLSFKGHHIVGDVNYGKGWLNRRIRETYNFHRMFLHCHFLGFIHPTTGEQINLHCDLDSELTGLLETLKRDVLPITYSSGPGQLIDPRDRG